MKTKTLKISEEMEANIEKNKGIFSTHGFCLVAIDEKCQGTILKSELDKELNKLLFKHENSRELVGILKAKFNIKS